MLVVGTTEARVIDPLTGKTRNTIPLDDTAAHGHGRLADDGTVLLYTDEGGTKVWRPQDGKYRQVASSPPGGGYIHSISADGSYAILAKENSAERYAVMRWDFRTGKKSKLGEAPSVEFAVSPSGVIAYCDVTDLVVDRGGEPRTIPTAAGPEESPSCSSVQMDEAGTAVVTDDRVVSLETEKATKWVMEPEEDDDENPSFRRVIQHDGRLFAVQSVKRRLMLTELPTGGDAPVRDVRYAALTRAGTHVVTLSDDGATLRVRNLTTDKVIKAARESSYVADGAPPLVLSRDGKLMADHISASEAQIRQLSDLRPLAEVAVPAGAATTFDDQGRFVTSMGTTVTWWDARTGKQLRQTDVAAAKLVDPTEEVRAIVPVDGDRIAVVTGAGILIADVQAGRKVDEIPVGPDALTVKFQQGTGYALVLKQGRTVELWDIRAKRRVGRPLTGVGDVDTFAGAGGEIALAIQFLDEPGAFVIAEGGGVNWYRPGSAVPFRRLQMSTKKVQRVPLSISPHAGRLTYREVAGGLHERPADVADLNPKTWYTKLCSVLDSPEFTPEEKLALPEGMAEERLCPR